MKVFQTSLALLYLMTAILAVVLLAALCGPPAHAQDNGLKIGLGPGGLTSLRYGGQKLLSSGALSVQKVTLGETDGSASPTQTTFDAASQTLTQTYPWGTVTCAYAVRGSRLDMTVGVRNTSDNPLSALWLQTLEMKFPQPPTGWVANYFYMSADIGDPPVVYADYGDGALAVCNEDFSQPLLVGFPGGADLQTRPLWVCTSNIGWLSPYLDPYLKRPIPAHGGDTYHISLRFGPGGAPEAQLAGDVYRRFAAAYPSELKWPDRRAIGTLHLAVSEASYHSATNPRGWFADPKVDVVTAAGIAAFRQRVLAYADAGIKVLKAMNAQGMITWDLEGEEYPQETTYLGEPRLLHELAPEMDGVADAYFRKFREAGLRTGVCIRPQRLLHTPAKTEQQEVTDPAQEVTLLYDKMLYANRRWGCTIFYVDSNGDPNVPYPASIFQQVTERLARSGVVALVMPEHASTRYYAYTAPYKELRLGVTATPGRVRAVYPQAFTSIYAPDGPLQQDHDALAASVRRGDVLMFRGWWDDPQNALIQGIYHDAGK